MSEQHVPAWAFKDPQAALNAPSEFVECLPIAVYACDAEGRVRWFNQRAAQLWGRSPSIGDDTELFCGSFKLYDLGGGGIRREETPMAYVLRTGEVSLAGSAADLKADYEAVAAAYLGARP